MKAVRFNLQKYSKEQGLHKRGDVKTHLDAIRKEEPSSSNLTAFQKLSVKFAEELNTEFVAIAESKEGDDMVKLESHAMLGKSDSVTPMLDKIETFILNNKIRDVQLPVYYKDIHLFAEGEQRKYSNLAHAVFHENYGLKALAYWSMLPDSYAMQIVGRYIWIHNAKKGRFELMKFRLSSSDVNKIIRTLESHKPGAKVNEQSPEIELDLYTGERVSILIEPRVRNIVITFRRVLRKKVSLRNLSVEDNLFPEESLPLYHGMSLAMPNTVITGPMGTGKTTLVRAMIHERPDHLTGISFENDYEIQVSIDNPQKKFIEMILNGSNFDSAIKSGLRTDADYGVVQEVRVDEAEGTMILGERLQKGLLATTHIWKTYTIPEQWARLICRYNGGTDLKAETQRVAEYVDLIILLQMDETKTIKWVESVEELRFNRENGEISTHQIQRRNPLTKQYEYRADITKQLQLEMRLKNQQWYEIFMTTLKNLEQASPIPVGEGVTIFNPAIADPQYRLALATEELSKNQSRTADAMERMAALMETYMLRKGEDR
ncbi:ATPase, T2SS/T4P/T4SS family [Bacillus sp. FJAT-28004]|uniref:GTP-binding protein n=1 Tax=Bacillus sp. FJAT-28004 TaxID=1679165 RepID=UPI0006B672B6|nr:ATPase, T2SS/T4P/T4SS family [Bacillus sp. FJAT-28004]